MLLCFVKLICIISWTDGFNIDAENANILSGPAGSHFGYSIALKQNKWYVKIVIFLFSCFIFYLRG